MGQLIESNNCIEGTLAYARGPHAERWQKERGWLKHVYR